jgi:hypothetical protein
MAINITVNTQLYLYQGFTLIDITQTGVVSYSVEREQERNQQRNWETVIQLISLRTQPEILETKNFVADVKDYSFGIKYISEHKIWTFKFGVEYQDIYSDGPDVFGVLKHDFKITPVILGLTETIIPEQAIFVTGGPWNNIYFKSLKS